MITRIRYSIFALLCFLVGLYMVWYFPIPCKVCYIQNSTVIINHNKTFSSSDLDVDKRENSNKSQGQIKAICEENISSNKLLRCHGPTGRLGNAMFDFATAMGIAHTLDYTFVIRRGYLLLKYFELNQIVADNVENVFRIPLTKWRNDTWRNRKIYSSYNLTLSGCYRVWGYFHDVSDEVRKAFTIRHQFLDQAREFLKTYSPNIKTLIGVHVRRGDFLGERQLTLGRIVASKEYINRAMNYYREIYKDAFFVVVSNDKNWCKNNILGRDVIFTPFREPILDMAILGLCDHVILTAGTFGWWGGWLAGGRVVYCKDYPRAGSSLDRRILFRDEFYPSDWIGFGNCSL